MGYRNRALLGVSTIILLAESLSGCMATGMPNMQAGRKVTYEVVGSSAYANNVTWSTQQGQQQDTEASLPWSRIFTTGSGFQSFVVLAQNSGSGYISCKITVDGKVIASQTSTGQYATVTCTGT